MKVSVGRALSTVAVLFAAAGFLFAQGGSLPRPTAPRGRGDSLSVRPSPQPRQPERKTVFLKADKAYSIRVADSTATCMVGNFAALHNGTVITCDSAIRYSDVHLECFGNVLINKNTTYIYGDRAEYRGDENRAEVFSPLVKVVDGDATLYTYRFVFDTKNSIGQFSGGGVLTNRDNLLESLRGYYYTDTREIVCVGEVEMRNDEYDLKGDSVVYNVATDRAEYYRNTNIWNASGDYLFADRGTYEKPEELYSLTLNGYILTPKHELWSDSLDYYRPEEHAVLRGNLQIDDIEHKTLAFGDYGEYWKFPGNALLTLRPSMVNYDLQQQPDSLFMRADTIFFYTIVTTQQPSSGAPAADSLSVGSGADSLFLQTPPVDSLASNPDANSLAARREKGRTPGGEPSDSQQQSLPLHDSLTLRGTPASGEAEVAEIAEDSEAGTTLTEDTDGTGEPEPELTPEERKARLREIAEKERAEKKAKQAAERKERLEQIAAKRQAKITEKLLAQKRRDSLTLVRRRAKVEERLEKRREKALRKGRELPDSSELTRIDSLAHAGNEAIDSLTREAADTPQIDSLAMLPPQDTLDSLDVDTIRRFTRAWRNVKIYRTDFQAVCDSLVAVGADSTLHLYIDPVLWNENNQVTSDVMDIYTLDSHLDRAEFVGHPIMIAQLDTAYYNQVSGKTMIAYFRNNAIFRNDVNGNVQTFYYLQEEGGTRVVDMLSIESGDASFYIEDQQIVGITYRNNPVFSMSPLERLPATQEFFLKDFRWEGGRRPDRDEVFDRTIRPSLRSQKEGLPRPAFPIRERIDARRTELMDTGRWADRDDEVPPDVLDWIRSKEEQSIAGGN